VQRAALPILVLVAMAGTVRAEPVTAPLPDKAALATDPAITATPPQAVPPGPSRSRPAEAPPAEGAPTAATGQPMAGQPGADHPAIGQPSESPAAAPQDSPPAAQPGGPEAGDHAATGSDARAGTAPPLPAPAPPAPPTQALPLPPNTARLAVSSVLGRTVDGPDRQDIGRVVDVLVDGSGQPRAAVIDFGGFMGLGSRKIAVEWAAFSFPPGGSDARLTLTLTPEEIKATPEYVGPGKPVAVVGPGTPAPRPGP
jgi:hypothetical protein